MTDIEVINLRSCKDFGKYPYDVYVGRKSFYKHGNRWLGGSPLGNPYDTKIHTVESHREVVDDYTRVFLFTYGKLDHLIPDDIREKWDAGAARDELSRLKSLYHEHGQLRIACWCTPLPCHSDTIRLYIDYQEHVAKYNCGESAFWLGCWIRWFSSNSYYTVILQCNDCKKYIEIKTNGPRMHAVEHPDDPTESMLHPMDTIICPYCHSKNTVVDGVRMI